MKGAHAQRPRKFEEAAKDKTWFEGKGKRARCVRKRGGKLRRDTRCHKYSVSLNSDEVYQKLKEQTKKGQIAHPTKREKKEAVHLQRKHSGLLNEGSGQGSEEVVRKHSSNSFPPGGEKRKGPYGNNRTRGGTEGWPDRIVPFKRVLGFTGREKDRETAATLFK